MHIRCVAFALIPLRNSAEKWQTGWRQTMGLGSAIARPLSHRYGAIARNYPYP